MSKDLCPKCGKLASAGLIGGFWVAVDEYGNPEGDWRSWQGNTELTTMRMCECGCEFDVAATNAAPSGVELIAAERARQISEEGWTAENDDSHSRQELALAAGCYALPAGTRPIPTSWPWARSWWKPSPDNRIRELVKAGALIAAEIDRLQRKGEA